MHLFAVATICPFLLTLAAIFGGGLWGALAIGYITILVFAMDRLIVAQPQNAAPDSEFPASDALLIMLGFCHFALLILALWAVAGNSGLNGAERGFVVVATALICGQISHPVAHELIHKSSRIRHLMGQLIYTSMLFGHHASAHLRVHHTHVGSRSDPNSAPKGQGFYRFAYRAWRGGFRKGLAAESKLRQGRVTWRHPYVLYVLGGLFCAATAGVLAGFQGLATLGVICLYAQLQILMADYVQHYGLQRQRLTDGRLEPVGPQHAWNAPHWFSSAMMLNAPRHSDHHMTPARPFPALQLDAGKMPCLPYALPVMSVIALFPVLWRRVMDPLCDHWHHGRAR